MIHYLDTSLQNSVLGAPGINKAMLPAGMIKASNDLADLMRAQYTALTSAHINLQLVGAHDDSSIPAKAVLAVKNTVLNNTNPLSSKMYAAALHSINSHAHKVDRHGAKNIADSFNNDVNAYWRSVLSLQQVLSSAVAHYNL